MPALGSFQRDEQGDENKWDVNERNNIDRSKDEDVRRMNVACKRFLLPLFLSPSCLRSSEDVSSAISSAIQPIFLLNPLKARNKDNDDF